MSNESLRESLEELRREVDGSDLRAEGARERLLGLIGGLEKQLQDPEDADHHASLLESLKESIEHLELEHPRATSILNRIMVTLGNAGI